MIEFAVVLVVTRNVKFTGDGSNNRARVLKSKTNLSDAKTKTVNVSNKVVPTEQMDKKFKQEMDEGDAVGTSKQAQLGFFKASSLADKIDVLAFAIFVLSYILFNCVYWIHYTN